MPAPRFLSGLPKPVLFGLYGAIGGLLGAVLLGEPAWQLLKPPVPPPPPPQIAVNASASVQLYPGTNNTFLVQLARAEFDAPVTVTFTGLPPGVTLDPVTIAAGKTQADATVTAKPTARVGTTKITVVAEGGGAKGTSAVDLLIAAIPPPPPRLAVAIPPTLTVFKKGTCKFLVQVARAGFEGIVSVDLGVLPSGITTAPISVPVGKNEVEVTLAAADVAALSTTTLTATATVAGTTLRATAGTKLSVQTQPLVPVDVMFVLDCTGSMEPFIEGVKDGIKEFARELGAKRIDFRLGLLAFRDRIFGQEPELLTFEKGSPFTTDVPLFSREVGRLRCIGNDTIPESSLDGMVEAARQPFRQSATKVLLLITDAEPLVPDKETRTVRDAVDFLKSKKLDQLYCVLRPADERSYSELRDAFPGKTFDLERVTRGGVRFATILPELSKAIANTVADRPVPAEVAAPPRLEPIRSSDAAKPTATTAPSMPTLGSLQSGERFASGSEGWLVLRSGVWTGAIAALVCLALLAGQHHYLRGSLPAVVGAAAGFGGGLAVGIVGGAAGQGLYLLAPVGSTLGTIFQIFGWALLGALAGVGLSLFIPNLKWIHGLAGGAIGGVVGALGFLAVSSLANEIVGRLIGGLLVGFSIGLMVALVEAAFRRAWLEVCYGARETITVNLGPEPVKVGGDARACTVWARGAAPLALRYFIRNGQVICDDAVMKRETPVGDGYAKEVGNVTVTVRTGTGTAATAPSPVRAASPPPPPKPVVAKSAAPLSLDDDFDPLPMAMSPPPPLAMPIPTGGTRPESDPLPGASGSRPTLPPVPPKPAVPATGSRPTLPPVPPRPAAPIPPTSKPTLPSVPPAAPKPAVPTGPRHADACPTPTCGRVNAGKPGTRYCMICDRTY